MNNKLKNPMFWLGMVTTVLLAAGVDFETLTSWPLLANALLGILQNPVALAMCIVTGYTVWNDNSTTKLDGFKNKR